MGRSFENMGGGQHDITLFPRQDSGLAHDRNRAHIEPAAHIHVTFGVEQLVH